MESIEVAVIEAGEDYTERLEVFRIKWSGDQTEAIRQARDAVAAKGYRVMPDEEGGHIVLQEVTEGEPYIAVTVYPKGE